MLLKLAAPNVVAAILMTTATFFDAWFVGRLGTEALASLALVFPFQTLIIMMAGGAIGGGVTSSISRALGAGNRDFAELVAWHAVLIAVGMAAFFAFALGFFARPVFAAMGGEGAVLDGAVAYARVGFGGGLALWLAWVMAAVIRGTGDTATPARAVLVTSVAQICLSGALTLGLGPFPALGVSGPATALILCNGLCGIYLIRHLLADRAAISLRAKPVSTVAFFDVMQVGGLGLINSTSIAASVVVVTGFVGTFGTEALAGYGLGSRLELMLVPLTFGVGGALTVAVGTNFGAGQFIRARQIALVGASAVFAVIGALGVTVALAPGLWLSLFTADPDAYRVGETYLKIVGPVYALFGFGQALYFASQGTGKLALPVLVGVLRLVVVACIGTAVIVWNGPLNALFFGVAIGFGIVGLGLGLCMKSRGWRPDHAGLTRL
jgi:putative MATE family efflux protein